MRSYPILPYPMSYVFYIHFNTLDYCISYCILSFIHILYIYPRNSIYPLYLIYIQSSVFYPLLPIFPYIYLYPSFFLDHIWKLQLREELHLRSLSLSLSRSAVYTRKWTFNMLMGIVCILVATSQVAQIVVS